MSLVLNGILCTNIEELEIAMPSLSEQQKQAIRNDFNGIINNPVNDPFLQVKVIILNAIIFGNDLISQFAAENVMMGITQDNMTGVVRKNMFEVINALSTGSLYDAIHEVKTIPSNKKDLKYITDARLLLFVNKIEAYLGIPISSSL